MNTCLKDIAVRSASDTSVGEEGSMHSNTTNANASCVRQATLADIDVLSNQRVSMFCSLHSINETDAAALEAATRSYFSCAIPLQEYRGWLLESGGKVAAGGGIIVRRLLPRPKHRGGGCDAYILNVYTEPQFRRRGFARQVMKAMLSWCREQGIKRISLHASDFGRPLYQNLGFVPTNEMRLEEE
jgi:GNAT superfamily N-acetyltransferase